MSSGRPSRLQRGRRLPAADAFRPALLDAVAVDQARADRVDPDAMRTEFQRRGLGEHQQRRLGGGVVAMAGRRIVAFDRGDVDDRARLAGFPRMLDEGADKQERTGDIRRHHGVPVAFRHVGQHLHRLLAGIVDQDIDAAEMRDRLRDQIGRALARRDVGLAGDSLAAGRPDRLGDRFGGLPVAVVVADDIGAGLAEAPGDAGADAAARAGDDGGVAGKVEKRSDGWCCGHRSLSSTRVRRQGRQQFLQDGRDLHAADGGDGEDRLDRVRLLVRTAGRGIRYRREPEHLHSGVVRRDHLRHGRHADGIAAGRTEEPSLGRRLQFRPVDAAIDAAANGSLRARRRVDGQLPKVRIVEPRLVGKAQSDRVVIGADQRARRR